MKITRDTLLDLFERVIVTGLLLLLVAMVALTLYQLWVVFVRNVGVRAAEIQTAADLQQVAQRGFGGVLIVLLGLELIETVRTYFREHQVRVEVVLLVALIATGRHILQIDLHESPATLFGLSALVVGLSGSYFLLKRVARAEGKHSEHRGPTA